MDPDWLASKEDSKVFHTTCEFIIINRNMKYRIVLTSSILVPGQVNRNLELGLNEMLLDCVGLA